jgi:hypothetical protein
MPAFERAGSKEIAAMTAIAVNRFRISRILSDTRAQATRGCDARGPRQVPPDAARVTCSALIKGRAALVSSSARLPHDKKNRYNHPRLSRVSMLAPMPTPAIRARAIDYLPPDQS